MQIGADAETQIVCGAPNVAAGQTVAIARPGAIMPDGTKLKQAKLRGVASDGMILAEDELAISAAHDETIVLDADGLVVGAAARGRAADRDRGARARDHAEPAGLPRRLRRRARGPRGDGRGARAARRGRRTRGSLETLDLGVEVVVEATDLCPRFTARVFEDVTIGPSPLWLKARLTAAGQRPINNVVDITNYVMLLTGQPLHAFDADRIAGAKLVVRRAGDGEQVATLDGQTRVLDPNDCLIADADGPTSIAGVMGGMRSEVQPDTTRVLMEVASWDGPTIHATSQKLGLRSEASARFEKGLSPEQAMEAQIVATALMLELTGARLVPGTIDLGGGGPPAQAIRLREQRVVGLLGVNITRSESALHLQALGFETAERPGGLDVTVPHWRRNDVTREADLIEEVARLHGMDDLPATLPSRRGAVGVLTPAQRLRRRAEDALAGRGLLEIVGWSFDAPERDDRLRLPADDPRRRARRHREPDELGPVGPAHDAARLAAGRRRAQRRARPGRARALRVRRRLPRDAASRCRTSTARSARSCRATSSRRRATSRLCCARCASRRSSRRRRSRSCIPAAARWSASGARSSAGSATCTRWSPRMGPRGRRGVRGRSRPRHRRRARSCRATRTSRPIRSCARTSRSSSTPPSRPRPCSTAVRAAGGKLLARAEVFDVYRGEQIAAGRTSLAIALTFRARDRTLTDADVAPVREKIVARLESELGGELRG